MSESSHKFLNLIPMSPQHYCQYHHVSRTIIFVCAVVEILDRPSEFKVQLLLYAAVVFQFT